MRLRRWVEVRSLMVAQCGGPIVVKLAPCAASVCSSVSLAVLLLTAGCLLMLNDRRKTSIRIHRNIVLCILSVQLLVLIIVLANAQLTAMPFLCTFTTMALHYASVATFVWVSCFNLMHHEVPTEQSVQNETNEA